MASDFENALYLYLYCFDERPDVDIGASGKSLGDLTEFASRAGLPSRIHRSTPDQLAGLPHPFVTIAHSDNATAPVFVLVTYATDQVVEFIECHRLTWHSQSTDEFQRDWCGYCVVPGATFRLSRAMLAWVAVLVGYVGFRAPAVKKFVRRCREGTQTSLCKTPPP